MPTQLVLTCQVEGLVYLNGRLQGEVGPDAPLRLPPCRGGMMFLEYHPLKGGYLCVTRRWTEDSHGEDLYVLSWPGGVTEVEIVPPRIAGADPLLPPEETKNGLCVGGCPGGGRYVARFQNGRSEEALTGDESYFTANGEACLFRRENDTAGHGRLVTFPPDGAPPETRFLWVPGAPFSPDTAEKAALCAIEAAQLDLWDEAAGYLHPSRRGHCLGELRRCRQYDGVTAMRHAPEGSPEAVALLVRDAPDRGHLVPVFYHALYENTWKIDDLRIGEA